MVLCCGQQKRNVAMIQSVFCLIMKLMKLLCVFHIDLGLHVVFGDYNYLGVLRVFGEVTL